MTFPDMLQSQINLFKALACGSESWKADHDDAMGCRDVEEAITIWLAFLSNIRRRKSAWTIKVEKGARPYSWDDAKRFDDAFKAWLAMAEDILLEIERWERKSYRVESVKEFREAIQDVSLMCLDTEHNRISVESIQSGNATSSKEAMDALRNNLRPRGS
jgi:hypothetical protein